MRYYAVQTMPHGTARQCNHNWKSFRLVFAIFCGTFAHPKSNTLYYMNVCVFVSALPTMVVSGNFVDLRAEWTNQTTNLQFKKKTADFRAISSVKSLQVGPTERVQS